MLSKSFDLLENQLVITFALGRSPLNISLTPKSPAPAFGAMVCAVPGRNTPATVLRDHPEYSDGARELAVALAQRFERPTYVNTSVVLGIGLVRQVLAAVEECMAEEAGTSETGDSENQQNSA